MNEYIAALVDELYQMGIRHAVFSPGSRSTTMAMLFKEHGGFETYMNIDERSAGFMALGIGKGHREPAVLVCTSGSAAAHYLPAILEAQYSGVPLIILSADRPYTLQHVGAPQTIDQQKIFGTSVNYYEELSVPQEAHYYTYPRQVARRAYMKAMDIKKGPVHINVPLFEPLIPDFDRKHFEAGRTAFNIAKAEAILPLDKELDAYLEPYNRILILAGPNCDDINPQEILSLSHRYQAPVLADPLSNVRQMELYTLEALEHEWIVGAYDAFLANKDIWPIVKPDCVIQFGNMVVSKRVQQMLATWDDIEYIEVNPTMDSRNPLGTTTLHLQCTGRVLNELMTTWKESRAYVHQWRYLESLATKQLDRVWDEPSCFEGRTIRALQWGMEQSLQNQIMVANSMTIRDFDYFWGSYQSTAWIYGNRGVNGIDGTISTALGIATNGNPTYLVTGDLSFFHDMNGLAVAKTHNLNLIILLHNNDGGGIFEYLPQKGTKHFDYLFSTSQGLDYAGVAQLYGCGYRKISNPAELWDALQNARESGGVQIIEIPTDKERSRQLHTTYTTISVDLDVLRSIGEDI